MRCTSRRSSMQEKTPWHADGHIRKDPHKPTQCNMRCYSVRYYILLTVSSLSCSLASLAPVPSMPHRGDDLHDSCGRVGHPSGWRSVGNQFKAGPCGPTRWALVIEPVPDVKSLVDTSGSQLDDATIDRLDATVVVAIGQLHTTICGGKGHSSR
jgi:hypothetical protein